jgi:hypothetical protein
VLVWLIVDDEAQIKELGVLFAKVIVEIAAVVIVVILVDELWAFVWLLNVILRVVCCEFVIPTVLVIELET